MKIQSHIEIVRSTSPSLSSMGKKSSDMIQAVLERRYSNVETTVVNNLSDLDNLVSRRPDLVFLGMKNIPATTSPAQKRPTKIWLSSYLEANGINYTGSVGAAIALDFDKPAAKRVVKTAGLNTSSYFVARAGQYRNGAELPLAFPLFVKPPNTGGGKGVGADSVVRDFAGFQQKVQSIATNFQSDSLVEEYLPGREFSVAILEDGNSAEPIAMPVELITEQNAQGDRILGQNIKSADTERIIAITDAGIRDDVAALAMSAFDALGARDYGRIDIRLDAQNIPHFLEANLIPGVADHDFTSYFTRACQINQGMDYETMILSIVELGLSRGENIDNFSEQVLVDATGQASFETVFDS